MINNLVFNLSRTKGNSASKYSAVVQCYTPLRPAQRNQRAARKDIGPSWDFALSLERTLMITATRHDGPLAYTRISKTIDKTTRSSRISDEPFGSCGCKRGG